ncbi:uncharacterized protein A4U43_C03F2590 [Asparagus officinalis]|uniref:Methyltransferase n=1 Tax=Asparagus officinalis TaxID=4686 RepID=A0A5P1F7C1_ASPOF|nr:uncharacterized protein A4U43_C03F2590 [Asparagus officinalis]
MSRPLYRGLSGGGRITSLAAHDVFDEDFKPKDLSGNGFGHDLSSPMTPGRTKHSVTISLLKLGLAITILAALSVSFYWTLSLSVASPVTIHRSYRRLQEQLITDLTDIGDLSVGTAKSKDLEFCPPEYENYVPCYYNVSESLDSVELSDVSAEYERQCPRGAEKERACLVLPPRNYRIPLRWPSGRDFIWKGNVKISGQEFSSGSLTKRMMVEEEQISFRSDSLMVDGVEDYSHQIAEMVGLRNESNFNEAGVRTVLDIGCGFGSLGAHLFSKQLLTMCIANYEPSASFLKTASNNVHRKLRALR